jgi:hypothetical protein
VDDAKASSPARVVAELANATTRQRLLSLARWIMKVNAPKEHSPNAADAEDPVQTAVALAYDPKKKPGLPPKTFLTHMGYVMKDVFIERLRSGAGRFEWIMPTRPLLPVSQCFLVVALLALVAITQCGSRTTAPPCDIEPTMYDTSCSVDSDCVAVPQGDVCSFECLRVCPTGAVNARTASRYMADYQARTAGLSNGGVCHCPALAVAPCCRNRVCSNSAATCN